MTPRRSRLILLPTSTLLLGITLGCGSAEDLDPLPSATSFVVGGTVTGLKGSGLLLRNNGGDDLPIAEDGAFAFPTPLKDGSDYEVTVEAQPTDPDQTCAVDGGSGAIAGAKVTTVRITCQDDNPPIPTHAVGGEVTGLKGSGLVLQNNGGDDLSIAMNGAFVFPTPVAEGAAYAITVATQPAGAQRCWVEAGTGAVGEVDVTDVLVRCSVDPGTIDTTDADRCDIIDPASCLFPFPNDYFTVDAPATASGRRVALNPLSTPANVSVDLSPVIGAPPGTLVTQGGVHIDPTDWNKSDGFSPGQMILTRVPGLDLGQSGIGGITFMERSLEPDAPVVAIDADTGERHLVWAELDSFATSDDTRALIIHAGTNFREGHRYIVALRGLRAADNSPLEPSPAFQVYRDGAPSTVPAIESRRAHFEDLFAALKTAGIAREDLYLAWDFTVASRRSLSERMIHIRDDAFASLGSAAPAFTITSVIQNPDSNRSRRIIGTFTVPNYLNQPGGVSGASFNYAQPDDGLPDQLNGNETLEANFICNIPYAALSDGNDPNATVNPGRAALYGHGQQGNASQVNGGSATGELSNMYNFVFCATDFIGMSDSDDFNILMLVTDFTGIVTLADRLQQGLLNNLFLARLMIHPQGFISDPAFQGGQLNQPLINTSDVYYYGISQGGILGGALVAVSQDIRRGVLGVTGMNYSLLLDRATGFDQLRPIMDAAYPDELDRRVVFSLSQMPWDRGETNGYAWHLTDDPLPGTPSHQVLMQVAFADHQVTQWSADIEGRTIGAFIHTPTLEPGRAVDMTPYYGIPAISAYPFFGSAMFVWDTGPYDPGTNTGTPPPPVENQALRDGADPHGRPRVQPGARLQISEFLKATGKVIDPCADAPCFAQ